MNKHRREAVAGIAAVLALTGCATAEPLSPSEVSSWTSIDPVERPLDLSAFRYEPCEALTEAQLAGVGYSAQQTLSQPRKQPGLACTWPLSGDGYFLAANSAHGGGVGPSPREALMARVDFFRQHYREYTVWRETWVDGLPTVVEGKGPAWCKSTTAPSEDRLLTLTLTMDRYHPDNKGLEDGEIPDACARLTAVLEALVANLRAG